MAGSNMKKTLIFVLLLAFIVLRGTIYAFTPTPTCTVTPTPGSTPVWVAVNAIGVYACGSNQMVMVTLTAQEYIDKNVAAVQNYHLLQIPTSAGWIISVGDSSDAVAWAKANFWYMTAAKRSIVLDEFPVLSAIETCKQHDLCGTP